MSTWPACSFCVCCFWQAVICLWSLHVSVIPNHSDLDPGRKVFLTSYFILSVLFLKFGEMFVVPTHVQDPLLHRPPPWDKCLPVQLVHSLTFVFDRWWDVCDICTCPWSPVTWTSILVGMSTWPACSFCVCCFWQVVRCLWSLHVFAIPCNMYLHPGRNVYLTSWFFCLCCILQVVRRVWSLHMAGSAP